MTERIDADVVIAGAGMGGLVTAVKTLDVDADTDVVVVEKGSRPGGSMRLSGGAIWTYDSVKAVRAAVPHGNESLQALVVNGLEEGLAWLDGLGVQLTDLQYDLPGSGKQADPAQLTDVLVETYRQRGGELRLNTALERLSTNAAGAVDGIKAVDDDGQVRIDADATVLATGGFQGNEELVEQFITEHTEHLSLRANPWSTGDGLLAAREVGAKTTAGMSSFNGHNLIAPPAAFDNRQFTDASQFYGPHAVALDATGRRFTDESVSAYDKTLAEDTAKRAQGTAYYVFDRRVYDTHIMDGHAGTKVKRGRDLGGRVAERDSLEGLGEALVGWEIHEKRAIETVRAYNEQVRTGEADRLDVPRTTNREPLDDPPFYAVKVQPGITNTNGGLDVDTSMRVLRRSTSISNLDANYTGDELGATSFQPIAGLFAAGTDIGNINHRGFLGGLSIGLVTGRVAGKHAVSYAGA